MEFDQKCRNVFLRAMKNGIYSLWFFDSFLKAGGDLWQSDQQGRFILHDVISLLNESTTGANKTVQFKTNQITLKAIKNQILIPMILQNPGKLFERICYRELFDHSTTEASHFEFCEVILQVLKDHPNLDTRDPKGNGNIMHYCVQKYHPSSEIFGMKSAGSLYLQILKVANHAMKMRLCNEKNGNKKIPYSVFLDRISKVLFYERLELMQHAIDITKSFFKYLDKDKLCLDDVKTFLLQFNRAFTVAQNGVLELHRHVLYLEYLNILKKLRDSMIEPMMKKTGIWAKLNNYIIHLIIQFADPLSDEI